MAWHIFGQEILTDAELADRAEVEGQCFLALLLSGGAGALGYFLVGRFASSLSAPISGLVCAGLAGFLCFLTLPLFRWRMLQLIGLALLLAVVGGFVWGCVWLVQHAS